MRDMNRYTSAALHLIAAGWLIAAPTIAFADANAGAHAAGQVESNRLRVTEVQATLPEVVVVRSDGDRVSLAREIDDGRPVILNFIFTSCPGICPIMSHTFSMFQDRLGPDRQRVHMVSISIDPEQDTPARLRAYAKQFSAGPQWQHYTGSLEASIAIQKSLGAYAGDKMSHDPITFIRAAPGQPWMRIDGFASAEDLMSVFARLTSHVVAVSSN